MDSRKTSMLEELPNDVKKYVIPLGPGGTINLARTRKHFHQLFSHNGAYPRALNSLNKLLCHIALGELEDAETIWKSVPDILTCRGTIYHPNRIYIAGQQPVDIPLQLNPGRYKYMNRTALQILLMNSEFAEAKLMAEHMLKEEVIKQYNEIFPHGEIKKYDFDLQEAKKILQALFEAIVKDESIDIEYDENDKIKNINMNDLTRKALYQLHVYAKPKAEHTIGLVFNPEFYLAALKLYDQNHFQLKFKIYNQNTLRLEEKYDRYKFWNICVEEWLAACLGTVFIRQHSRGFANTTTRRGCLLADGSSYFAFRRSSDSIPGFHIRIGSNGARRIGERPPKPDYYSSIGAAWHFQNLCEATMKAQTEFVQLYSRSKMPIVS